MPPCLAALSPDFVCSAAAFPDPESASELDDPDDPDEPDEVDPADSSLTLPLVGLDALGRASRASFFAQPLPLNTIAGVDMSLRIGPPHFSHAVGPVAFTP